jgi:hypothetical protein
MKRSISRGQCTAMRCQSNKVLESQPQQRAGKEFGCAGKLLRLAGVLLLFADQTGNR